MSAQIPETKSLKDILKATGYDCPEELQNKTFADATGGIDIDLVDLTATENKVYTPEEGKAFKSVNVQVPSDAKAEEALSVTKNGTYFPDAGKTFNSVTVNVAQSSDNKGPDAPELFQWTCVSPREGMVGETEYLYMPFNIAPDKFSISTGFFYGWRELSINVDRGGTTYKYKKIDDHTFEMNWCADNITRTYHYDERGKNFKLYGKADH